MENKGKTKSLNSIITGLMTAAFAVVMGLLYAYYYDLNDDVLMKDLLSGVFTGEPCSHNIQMLYSISFFISLFYRIFRNADCYGIYLLLCQYISLFIILRFVSGNISKLILGKMGNNTALWKNALIHFFAALPLFAVVLALMPGHLVMVQYTYAVAMICAAAAVLFSENKDVFAVILVILAFCTRSEMTLLMLPFVLLVPFFRYFDENGKNLKEQIIPVFAVVVGLIVCELINFAGYSSKEWREFNSFFDSRTQIYDFYQIPDYEENKVFYDSIQLKRSEYELLVNYNFGLDSDIDASKMAKIADYAKSISTKEGILPAIKKNLPLYFYRLRSIGIPQDYEYPMTDSPWNIVTGAMYVITFVLTFLYMSGKKSMLFTIWSSVWRLLILFGGRTLLWMYILVRGRDPIRITHSLYLLEITVLVITACKMLVRLVKSAEEKKHDNSENRQNVEMVAHFFAGFCVLVFFSVCIRYIPEGAKIVKKECLGRDEYNRAYEELDNYFKEHGDEFFFVDVYSSVAYADMGYTYSQRMLHDTDNSVSNSVLMGGWASKSPAEKQKLLYFCFDEPMEEAILEDKSYIVSDMDDDMEWIFNYYLDKDRYVTLTREDEVAGEFVIWKMTENKDTGTVWN
ncbi:hypothetical protein [Butyrivibrio sp. AE3004]|uniref:hypothetical protein n=1 Tax=Butyrivibrio sp. AE3004 TaxID=1506994 RepID=UPI00049431A3|nr:hypothetical protein [Butyrivibrio sp. AE3004]